jgi:DNA replication initiation complex subunit (GINS family)
MAKIFDDAVKLVADSKYYEWLLRNEDPENIFAPPMKAQDAVDMLMHYLLGEDWYSVNPVSTEQINTEAVYDILMKHSRRFRREEKQISKNLKGLLKEELASMREKLEKEKENG